MDEHFWVVAPRFHVGRQAMRDLQISPDLPEIRVTHGYRRLQGLRGVVKLVDPRFELHTYVFPEILDLVHSGHFR